MLSAREKQVILALQRDLSVTPAPFQEVAARAGVSEAEVLEVIRELMGKGYIRRFGATLRHQLSGFKANALVAWRLPENKLQELGKKLAGYRAVTHCYIREPAPEFPYNLYTMIHGQNPEDILRLAGRMAADVGVSDYDILFSDVELKKTTMRYFQE